MKKYKYQDWLDGKVILKYNYFREVGDDLTLVEWENFNAEDSSLIKKEQKKIFDDLANTLLEKYKSEFSKEIEASLDPDNHCKKTISQISDIFESVIPQTEIIITEFWNCVFSFIELTEIQQCYKNNILRGLDLNYNFIYSPKGDSKWINENPQIFAYALFMFRQWILDYASRQIKKKKAVIKAPVKALFCNLLNQVGVFTKEESESIQNFCKRVCDEYKMDFTPRIGKAFYCCNNKSNLLKVRTLILPSINMMHSRLITNYLDNDPSIKQKLFV